MAALLITQVKSANGGSRRQREAVRGLIQSIQHLVEVRDG
jgi:ribosomal protein L30/L7E